MRMHRPGITLLEVLIAIFVMGIGMLALLVLFPLGAMSMAQALKDDRIAHSERNAAALLWANEAWKDPGVQAAMPQINNTPPPPLTNNNPPIAGLPAPILGSRAYPVYVDPYYATVGTPTTMGTGTPVPIWRVFPTYVTNHPSGATVGTNYWFSLLDDITNYDSDGLVSFPAAAGVQVQRQGRFTWAYMLRQSKAGNPASIDASVVVYAGRSTQLALGENSYTLGTPGTVGDVQLVVPWNPATQEQPDLRRGTWILDVSLTNGGTAPPRGDFYRVINAVNLGNNSIQIEVEPRLATSVYQIVVMEKVVDVKPLGLIQ